MKNKKRVVLSHLGSATSSELLSQKNSSFESAQEEPKVMPEKWGKRESAPHANIRLKSEIPKSLLSPKLAAPLRLNNKICCLRIEQGPVRDSTDINKCLLVQGLVTRTPSTKKFRRSSVNTTPKRCTTPLHPQNKGFPNSLRSVDTPLFSSRNLSEIIVVGSATRNTWDCRTRSQPRTCGNRLTSSLFMTEDSPIKETRKPHRAKSHTIEESPPKSCRSNTKQKVLEDFIRMNKEKIQTSPANTIIINMRRSKPGLGIEKVIVKRYSDKNTKKKLLRSKMTSIEDWKKRYEFWSDKFAEIRFVQDHVNKIMKGKN